MRHFDMVDIEMRGGQISRSFVSRILGEGDVKGDQFGVNVFLDGEAYTLSGSSCVGYFIRNNGDTTVIAGTVSGNQAYVVLPQACYVYEGKFTLAIKLVHGGDTETLRIVDGSVVNVIEGTLVDPGTTIPSLADYTALVTRVETAADTIDNLSTSATLIAGDRWKCSVTLAS